MSFSLNVLKLLSARVAVQVLAFVTLPIITRLFLPEYFGVFQIFESIANVLLNLTCLHYEYSIPLARNDEEAVASLAVSGLITLCFTSLITAVVAMGRADIATWFKSPELQKFLWFLPIVVFAGGIRQVLVNWVARKGQFGIIAWSELGQSLSERLIQLAWGMFIRASVAGLFVARLIASIVYIGGLFTLMRRELIADLKVIKLTPEMLWGVIKRHKKFPLFTTWAMFLNRISDQLIPFFFGTHFSITIVGYYSLGYKILYFPMTVLSNSVQKVFFPAAAKEYHTHGSLTNIVSQSFTRLVQIGVFPMAVVSFFGPTLVTMVFGHQWHEAGRYAQILAVWCLIDFIKISLWVFTIVNRQELSLLMDIITLSGRTIGLLIGMKITTPLGIVGIFVIISVCCSLGDLIWKLRLSHVSVVWALKNLLQYIILSCIFIFPVKLLSLIVDDFRFVLGMLGFAIVLYGIALLKIDHSFRQFFFSRYLIKSLVNRWMKNK